MNLLRNLIFVLLVGTAAVFVGCGDDNNDPDCTKTCEEDEILTIDCECVPVDADNTVIVSNNITADATWTNDKIWILASRVAVTEGATLTIEPGTIIKGEAGAGANATALLIARGAKLMAEGTASNPIIFTSVADEIQPGQIVSPNLDSSISGLWGGLIVLGKARISSSDGEAVQIEGIPTEDANGLYGGTTGNDNSGVIKYISVRHGGADIGEGNEINGITLGGVGSGTVIENIEVVSNTDDGIECFGGDVNIKNAIVWNQGDDSFDMDQAYMGTIDNFVAIAGKDTDHALELDGPEGPSIGTFTLKNGTLKGWNEDGKNGGEYADFRDGVTCNIENVYFFNFSEDSDVELDNNGVAQNYLDGKINFKNVQFNVSHLSEGNTTLDKIFVEKTGEGESILDALVLRPLDATVEVVANGTTGADLSVFAGWTLTAQMSQLDW